MNVRKKAYGDRNMVGRKIEMLRTARGIYQKDMAARMQTLGCDINITSYSKLEGQFRSANDKEIYTIAKILNVSIDELFKAIPHIE